MAMEERLGNEHGAAMTYHQLGMTAEERRERASAVTSELLPQRSSRRSVMTTLEDCYNRRVPVAPNCRGSVMLNTAVRDAVSGRRLTSAVVVAVAVVSA